MREPQVSSPRNPPPVLVSDGVYLPGSQVDHSSIAYLPIEDIYEDTQFGNNRKVYGEDWQFQLNLADSEPDELCAIATANPPCLDISSTRSSHVQPSYIK
jgi:hypothetical protein